MWLTPTDLVEIQFIARRLADGGLDEWVKRLALRTIDLVGNVPTPPRHGSGPNAVLVKVPPPPQERCMFLGCPNPRKEGKYGLCTECWFHYQGLVRGGRTSWLDLHAQGKCNYQKGKRHGKRGD